MCHFSERVVGNVCKLCFIFWREHVWLTGLHSIRLHSQEGSNGESSAQPYLHLRLQWNFGMVLLFHIGGGATLISNWLFCFGLCAFNIRLCHLERACGLSWEHGWDVDKVWTMCNESAGVCQHTEQRLSNTKAKLNARRTSFCLLRWKFSAHNIQYSLWKFPTARSLNSKKESF